MINVGFIGLGLIGGSIARSLRKADSTIHITAYNRSRNSLEAAVSDGVIDTAVNGIDNSFAACDIIFLCTPVEHNLSYLRTLKPLIKNDCIITDVGSVKGYIHREVHKLGMDYCFIGGHPMAGSEKTGYNAATDVLLQNAYYAITPTAETTEDKLAFYTELVKLTGAIPIVVDPDEHDYAVAGISHVPHLIAAGLVNTVRENDTADGLMKLMAAGGFKDITRIASSSADMWSQICSVNADQISAFLGRYIDYMTSLKEMVDTHNTSGIAEAFTESKEYRDSIDIQKKGVLPIRYAVYCDIEDKEGALSSITALLSDNGINIKNIEIIHNREYMQGVLLIEFYDEDAYKKACIVLTDNNYIINRHTR